MWLALIKREWLIHCRQRTTLLTPLCFFLLVITLFPLALGTDKSLLSKAAPAIIWLTLLLSSLLSMDSLFRDDHLDGSLEQLLLLSTPLSLIVIIKVLVNWLFSSLPLLLLTPLAGLLLAFDFSQMTLLLSTLFLGSLTISFIAAMGAALTFPLTRGGALLSLLVLPLYVPVLIFSMSAVEMASLSAYWPILLAFTTASITFCPLAIATILRFNLS